MQVVLVTHQLGVAESTRSDQLRHGPCQRTKIDG